MNKVGYFGFKIAIEEKRHFPLRNHKIHWKYMLKLSFIYHFYWIILILLEQNKEHYYQKSIFLPYWDKQKFLTTQT